MSAALQALIVTIDATSQTLVVALGGVYLARSGYVDKTSSSVISRMVMNLILPCLIFSDVMTSVTLSSLSEFGQVILFTTCEPLSSACRDRSGDWNWDRQNDRGLRLTT